MDKFAGQAEIWKKMPRNNETEIKAADAFYDDEIFPLVVQKFLKENHENKKYDLMFVTVGTSWQPVALSIMLHKPRHVVYLCTDDVLDKAQQTINFTGDNITSEICVVNKSDSKDMMLAIYTRFHKKSKNLSCCLDITGGTKAMAAAAAMMAAELGIEVFYIESRYLPVFRHPEPGSERVVHLLRPENVI